MERFDTFEKKNNLSFSNKDLLKQAFVHRSYLNENRGFELEHNERLEFLGDAVLELVITDYLYNKYTTKTEGDLTAYRSALVNANILSQIATESGVNDLLFLSRGEAKDKGRARQVILADTFEAVIGAIYIDRGYDEAKKFIAAKLFAMADEVVTKGLWMDPKSRFQEKAQDRVSVTPAYKTTKEVGPDHDKQFTVGVYIGSELVAEGCGKSKQEAEQEAAKKALEVKGW
ncbi:MAG: ribonuclease III [bacterium]